MSDRIVEFVAYGTPVTKGSARAFYVEKLKRAVITSATRGLKAWERSVRDAAQKEAGELFLGPVVVSLAFTLPRPQSLPKRVVHHVKRPDLDKLARSILDALTGVIWKDDSQVVQLIASKGYPGTESGTPHVRVRIIGS